MTEKEESQEPTPNYVDIFSIDIYSLISLLINIFTTQAWQYIGLRVRPATQKIEKNLSKAQVAIDCVAFLIKKLESQLSSKELQTLQRTLTDLQINYVRSQDDSKTTSSE